MVALYRFQLLYRTHNAAGLPGNADALNRNLDARMRMVSQFTFRTRGSLPGLLNRDTAQSQGRSNLRYAPGFVVKG
jgi:hypothetical protein